MEIEIELTLVINIVLNSFILKLASLILKQRARLFVLWATLGGIIALVMPLFMMPIYCKILLQIFTCFLLASLTFMFNSPKQFLVISSTITLMTFVFGGGCYALQNLIGSFPLFVVAIVGSVIYVASYCIIRYQQKRNIIENFCYKVKIIDGDKTIEEEGFLDTGNMLYDSISKKPIMLVTFDIFHKLYDNVSFINAFTKKTENCSIKNGHYIKINSVGSGTSMLIFSIDELIVGGERSFKNAMLGLSFSGFDKSFGKKILLHSELV